MFGGLLGTRMMIPLRRSLIVNEHKNLPYPEGTACASVLVAGEKGGDFAKTAYQGLGFAVAYALLQKIFHVIAETPAWVTKQTNKIFPSATVNGEITPEYLGVGYIIGPKIAGVLVAGGVVAWLDSSAPGLARSPQDDRRTTDQTRIPEGSCHRGRAWRVGSGDPDVRELLAIAPLQGVYPPDWRGRRGGRRFHHADEDLPDDHLLV